MVIDNKNKSSIIMPMSNSEVKPEMVRDQYLAILDDIISLFTGKRVLQEGMFDYKRVIHPRGGKPLIVSDPRHKEQISMKSRDIFVRMGHEKQVFERYRAKRPPKGYSVKFV